MAARARKRILIICALDGFANSVRPSQIKKYLERQGHEVETIDILETERSRRARDLVRPRTPRMIQQYGSHVLLRRRAHRLERLIRQKRPDVVICETYEAACALTRDLPCMTVYDAPTPRTDELYFSGEVSRPMNALHRRTELEIFERVDFLVFHWESYYEYVKKRYTSEEGYAGENMLVLNWGCTPRSKQATFRNPPRVAYFGSLRKYWVNLPLLAELSRQYPIDVYGEPPPSNELDIHYRGYADPEVLAQYQFGLITITDDDLRREGFSAKHLEYVSYGLPVLCPEWRRDPRLEDVTIPFNERNFVAQLHRYSIPDAWGAMHENCVRKAVELSWDRQLRPLDQIVDSSSAKLEADAGRR
jgi:Glycosyltransferase Family 4